MKTALHAKGKKRGDSFQKMHCENASGVVLRNDLQPSLNIQHRSIISLRLPNRNVRKVDAAHCREIAASISHFGFTVPVLIEDDGTILDGALRFEAAKLLGITEIPCILVSHLSPMECRLLRIAVNRLQEKGDWDIGALKIEFEDLIIDGAPIEISGFTAIDIDQILMGDEPEPVEPGPVEPEHIDLCSDIKAGDTFDLGPHKLICGDARSPEIMKTLMGNELASYVLTDQPYNVRIAGHVSGGKHREFAMASGEMSRSDFRAFNVAWMNALLPYLRDGGLLGTFIDWRSLDLVVSASTELELSQLNLVVWSKTNAGMGSLYRSRHELFPLFKKGSAPHTNNVSLGRFGRSRTNVWAYPGASTAGSDARHGLKDHPTVKPVSMLEDALLDVTNRGEIVIDPFAGSGSTLIAAQKTGRVCRAVEIDPSYVALILRRYKAVAG